jgi:hypothetical protein
MISPNSSQLRLELLQLDLRDRSEVGRVVLTLMRATGPRVRALDVGGLFHDVFTRQIIAARLEDLKKPWATV